MTDTLANDKIWVRNSRDLPGNLSIKKLNESDSMFLHVAGKEGTNLLPFGSDRSLRRDNLVFVCLGCYAQKGSQERCF